MGRRGRGGSEGGVGGWRVGGGVVGFGCECVCVCVFGFWVCLFSVLSLKCIDHSSCALRLRVAFPV